MRLHFLLSLGAVLVVAACKKDKPPEVPSALDVFPTIVMPPNASYVSKSGSAEALSLRLRTTLSQEAATNFYRSTLRPPAWHLISDAKDNEGAALLYAESGGRPVWIRIWPDSEFNATFVEMTGAVAKLHPDSLATDSARARAADQGLVPVGPSTITRPR